MSVSGLALAFAFACTIPLHAQNSSTSPSASPSKSAARPVAKPATDSQPSTGDQYIVESPAVLRDAPASAIIGAVQKATTVTVVARDHGWTQVRMEGWIPDSLLAPADTTFRAGLSAADLRADPVAARGMTVVWKVQFLALQTADPLRHGLEDGEPYILAKGPNLENALSYLVVPPSLLGTARALQPLQWITVTARVRDGKSDPVGIPILDIQTIRRSR
ncbi:MAG: SH3 domain-containing protein [Gemmatimonadaceae bacterium]